MRRMDLITLDLPAPAAVRNRWAAYAAVQAARGWGDAAHATDGVWHFDDGGGNWADLLHVDGGRAVLIGNDHEYSDTYWGAAAEYFGEDETDLLAGVPDWWAAAVRTVAERDTQNWIGFAYGWDGSVWRRAAYAKDDGFASLGLPALSDERFRELVGDLPPVEITADWLRAVVGPDADVDAGVDAARAFR
jgi:hypothetical protein